MGCNPMARYIIAALALSACATTADLSRISDQTYSAGKGVAVSPIPPPRPVRTVDPCRIWNDRPSILDECSGSDVQPVERETPSRPAEPTPAPHPETPKPVEPPKQPEPPKGNASANNGSGGNYDKTGHTDNGKGNGRGRH
jgi:hypothetical protein